MCNKFVQTIFVLRLILTSFEPFTNVRLPNRPESTTQGLSFESVKIAFTLTKRFSGFSDEFVGLNVFQSPSGISLIVLLDKLSHIS
jgi:hypothetical protein